MLAVGQTVASLLALVWGSIGASADAEFGVGATLGRLQNFHQYGI